MDRPFPRFAQALRQMGKNDKDRAARLGVAPRTVASLRAGRLPPQIALVARHRALLLALLLDLESTETTA